MGSQPIRIQFRKILWENLAGKSCGKLLRDKEEVKKKKYKKGSDWWKFSISNRIQLRKILQENLVGQGGGDKANLRNAVIGGNSAFEIGL